MRRLLDTDAGEVERAAAGADFETALSPVESGDYASISEIGENANTGSGLQGVVAASIGATLNSDSISLTQVYTYESADATDVDAIRNNTQLGPLAGADSLSYESGGRTVTLMGTLDPSTTGQDDGQQRTTPQAQFDFDYDGETVTVGHQGGDTFNEENTAALEVTTGDRRGEWLARTDDGAVSAGDAF